MNQTKAIGGAAGAGIRTSSASNHRGIVGTPIGSRASPKEKDPHRPRSDDERIDEASDESFPASDPPQQP